MRRYFFYLLLLAAFAAAACSLLSYLGNFHWIFDLLSHFKAQYLTILIISTGFIFFYHRKLSLMLIPLILLTSIDIFSIYRRESYTPQLSDAYKIISINLLSTNNNYQEVSAYVGKESPEILIFLEYTFDWQANLLHELERYTYRMEVPREDNFGMAVFSTIPIANLSVKDIGPAGVPSIMGDLMTNSAGIKLIATHPIPPINSFSFHARNQHLNELADMVSGTDKEVILIGDLNISSFSVHFKRLLLHSDLTDSRKGFGLLTTWPTWFLPARTTLDHILISKGIRIKSRTVGNHIGSDHLPISMEFLHK